LDDGSVDWIWNIHSNLVFNRVRHRPVYWNWSRRIDGNFNDLLDWVWHWSVHRHFDDLLDRVGHWPIDGNVDLASHWVGNWSVHGHGAWPIDRHGHGVLDGVWHGPVHGHGDVSLYWVRPSNGLLYRNWVRPVVGDRDSVFHWVGDGAVDSHGARARHGHYGFVENGNRPFDVGLGVRELVHGVGHVDSYWDGALEDRRNGRGGDGGSGVLRVACNRGNGARNVGVSPIVADFSGDNERTSGNRCGGEWADHCLFFNVSVRMSSGNVRHFTILGVYYGMDSNQL